MKQAIYLMLTICVSCSSVQSKYKDATSKNLQEKTTLLISDGSSFVPKAFYPKFSWEVTPQYFMFADANRLLTKSEVKKIANKTDFICIEKNHAVRDLEHAEIGAREEIEAFKAFKPSIKVLYYFNSAYAWPFTSYNQNFTLNRIEAYPDLKKFLITNKETGALEKRGSTLFFDVLNPKFREWWVKIVAQGVKDSGADGVFIDQMHGFVSLRSTQKTEVEIAMGEMMHNLKNALEPNKILLGNNASHVEEVFPTIDAAMFEHYNPKMLTKENLLKEWGYMLNNAKAGKISVFRFGVEAENSEVIKKLKRSEREIVLEDLSKERLEYYHACYLIGAQPFSYLQYGWGWRLSTGPLVNYHDLLKPLGAPKGAYKRIHETEWEFTREFEHAKVWIDTEKKQAKITWLK